MFDVQIGGLTLSHAGPARPDANDGPLTWGRTSEQSYDIYLADRTQHLTVNGRRVVLQPGDFTLAHSASASTIVADEPHAMLALRVPASVLRAYVRDPERAVGVCFQGADGPSRVVSLMLREMCRMVEGGALSTVGNRLLVSMFQAFAACCDLLEPHPSVSASSAAARRAQIRAAIDARLRDPELSLRSLARELGLSTRYIQMLFNERGESISRYVRNCRLEACRRELADPACRTHSVTAIAFRWGFNSAAHFCRVFRARYGTSPSRFREHALAHDVPERASSTNTKHSLDRNRLAWIRRSAELSTPGGKLEIGASEVIQP
ncbi:MAG TPA: helix-turn-helix domain-containing protein [Steroidobacteraceae bacterium]|nr:helix-turn-helix domain-containing protein [Steroidobacteraceae bacterium]